MDDTIPRQMGLGCVRKLIENQPVGEPDREPQAAFFHGSCLQVFPPSLTSVMDLDLEEELGKTISSPTCV